MKSATPFQYAVTLTGNIGSGKSTVCSFLKMYGFEIIDADVIAKQILEDSKDVVAELFGPDAVVSGVVNRGFLRANIFKDAAKKKALEALLHPRIKKEIERQAVELDKKETPYIVDIPLFFETQNYPIAFSLLVYVPKEIAIERASKRDNKTREAIEEIMDTQMDSEAKKKLASEVIDNSGSLKELQREIERVVGIIKKKYGK